MFRDINQDVKQTRVVTKTKLQIRMITVRINIVLQELTSLIDFLRGALNRKRARKH